MTTNLSDSVVGHLAAATFESLPPAVVERAQHRLLDSLGLIAAGTRAAGSREAVGLVARWGGSAEATALTTRATMPAAQAAFANAILVRSYDFEPVGADRADGTQIPSHITGTTVPVALAVAEARGATGRELITALAYGDDIAARLGHATGFDVYGGGDNTGTINALGGVATAGILAGLSPRELRNALGIAVNQLAGSIDNINDKTLSFKLPIALSARNAVFSAELAATGFGSMHDPIGGRFGFLTQWGDDPDRDAILDGLGTEFFSDATIKPWPTCRASQPPLDATIRTLTEHDIRAEDIASIRVHVTPRVKAGFVGQPFVMGESPEVSGAFSIEYVVATAALEGTVALRHMTAEFMRDPRLREMLARVELVDDLEGVGRWGSDVEIVLADGTVRRTRTETTLGDIHFAPLDDAARQSKFRDAIAWGGLTASAGSEIEDIVAALPHGGSVERLPALLASDWLEG